MENTTQSVVLLDGGMGQELVRRSGRNPEPLWSADVMMKQPDIVRDVHTDFIRAGAKIITLNTYSVTPERLSRYGDASQFRPLTQVALDIAHQARDSAGVSEVKIAGCLPPLVASYRPDIVPVFDVALSTYRQLVEAQTAGVDMFMAETMSSVNEVKAVVTAAKESGKPVWIALSVEDDGSGNLRSGEPLELALTILDDIGVDAVLLNCSKPEAISATWQRLTTSTHPIGAYANGFTSIAELKPGGTVDALEARHDLNPAAYADFALQWVKNGASIVGGCCEVGPDHIATLATRLQESGYSISADIVK